MIKIEYRTVCSTLIYSQVDCIPDLSNYNQPLQLTRLKKTTIEMYLRYFDKLRCNRKLDKMICGSGSLEEGPY